MKISGFWALFLVLLLATLMFFNLSSNIGGSLSSSADLFTTRNCFDTTTTTTIASVVSRKLKENETSKRIKKNKGVTGEQVSLDDYPPRVDPSPISKYVKPGPIEHGTPLIPYIPRFPPPPDDDDQP